MSLEEGGGRCPRSSQGGISEEVTSFEGLTAGEEAAAAPERGLKAADLGKDLLHGCPRPAPGNSGSSRFLASL